MVALLLNDNAQVVHGYSHLVFETVSLGLLLRYILNGQKTIKLEFADSISFSENGSIEDLYFQHLVDRCRKFADDLHGTSDSLPNSPERISHSLLNMKSLGVISSRSDVIALLSGELLQLRIEKSIFFKTSYHWEPHYFLLTSIGIFKF